MSYKNQKLLLVAAREAYKRGEISREKYSLLLNDIKEDIFELDKKMLQNEVNSIIRKYA
jgi:hypothetical protein